MVPSIRIGGRNSGRPSRKGFLGSLSLNGWWRLRKFLRRYDSTLHFSLVVTITLQEQEIDLYTEIATQIELPVAVQIPTSIQ
jgi:hypothetical protein